MSQSPLCAWGHKVRWGTPLGQGLQLHDMLWSALTDKYTNTPMGITAENLAEKYGVTREDCDEYAARSQQTWAAAQAAGVFDAEIEGVEYKGKKGPETLTVDEGPRADTTAEGLARLKPVFKKGGVVTAGNSSGINDGAASLVVASESAVKQHGFTPIARLVSWATCAPLHCCPSRFLSLCLTPRRLPCCAVRVWSLP